MAFDGVGSRSESRERRFGRAKRSPEARALDLGRFTVSRNRGGRPKGPNPLVRHRSRKPLADTEPCHVTLKVRAGLPSLRRADVVRELEAAFRRGNERNHFRLVHYSIQADHAHLIVEAKDRDALGRGMKSLAARFARAVNRALGRTGRVLADRYHLRILTCPRQVRNALAYVLLDARRHAAKRIAQLQNRGLAVEPLPNRGTLDALRPRAGSPAGVATSRSIASRRVHSARRPRWPSLTPGPCASAGGGMASWTRTRSRVRSRRSRVESVAGLRPAPPAPAAASRETPETASPTARANPHPNQPFRLRSDSAPTPAKSQQPGEGCPSR